VSAAQDYNPPPPPEQPGQVRVYYVALMPDDHLQTGIGGMGRGEFFSTLFGVGCLAVSVGVFIGLYVFTLLVTHSISSSLGGQ
jgi:hypothetical protein